MKRSTDQPFAAAVVIAAGVATMILAACARLTGSSVVEAPMVPVDGSAPPSIAAAELAVDAGAPLELRAGSRFAGSYVCNQGRTLMSLEIDEVEAGEDTTDVQATFTFDYVSGRPRVHGAFRASGTWDPETRTIALTPDEWTEDPSNGWVMVGLHGTLTKDGRSVTGTIDGPGCTTFSVKRKSHHGPAGD